MIEEIAFLALTFILSMVTVVTGFGTALILIPFSAFIFPIKEAIALVTIVFIAGNISKVTIFRKHINWKIVLLVWIGAIPLVFIGAYLMVYAPSEIIEKILGVLILSYVINDYFGLTEHIRLNKWGIIGGGGAYGFFSGIIGTGSAINAALFSHLGLTKEKFVATMGMTMLFMNLIKAAVYSKFSLINSSDTLLIIGLVACAFAGNYAGRNFHEKIKPETFRKIILVVLLLISLKLIIF